MRFCDLTFAYTESSGGIRTYLDQKRRHLLSRTEHEHVLIIPGEETRVEREGRAVTYWLESPLIPGCEPYRFFCRPRQLFDVLQEAAPDVVELGSFFLEPWMAFRVRKEFQAQGRRCVVGGYFHTDLAGAYFGGPVRTALGAQLAPWSELVSGLGTKLGDLLEAGAETYFGGVFAKCDLMLAASAVQAKRLADYGIEHAHVVPLGVDLERFSPRQRSEETRGDFGAGERTAVMIYAGRLDREKRVQVLVEAFEHVRLPDKRLVLIGEGPMRAELEARAAVTSGLIVRAHERDPEKLARLLASADVYVTAGPHETFGLSVVEAQASGLPVVGVRAGALIERVVEGTGFLGPVDDAETMARHVEAAMKTRTVLSACARRHVEKGGFGWERTFERLLRLYEERCGRADTVATGGATEAAMLAKSGAESPDELSRC